MVFEKYKPSAFKGGDYWVYLGNKDITMNAETRRRLKTEFIEIAYDKEFNVLKISASEESENSYKLTKFKFSHRGLLQFFNIEERGYFKAEFNLEDRSIYVDLHTPVDRSNYNYGPRRKKE